MQHVVDIQEEWFVCSLIFIQLSNIQESELYDYRHNFLIDDIVVSHQLVIQAESIMMSDLDDDLLKSLVDLTKGLFEANLFRGLRFIGLIKESKGTDIDPVHVEDIRIALLFLVVIFCEPEITVLFVFEGVAWGSGIKELERVVDVKDVGLDLLD